MTINKGLNFVGKCINVNCEVYKYSTRGTFMVPYKGEEGENSFVEKYIDAASA